jgi:arginyl-tRNA synthetase
MVFNPAESIDLNGNTGPFIQYTYARIRSVMKKGEPLLSAANGQHPTVDISKGEKQLIKIIYQYSAVIKEAAKNLSPAVIANYAYELSKAFNHFYHEHVIVDENANDVSVFRLKLSDLTASVIKHSMKLLGIQVPERM